MAYGFPENEIIACPFCGSEIAVLFVPEATRTRRASWGGQAGKIRTRTSSYLVQKPCSHCNKTAEEIENELNRIEKEHSKVAHGAFEKRSHAFSKNDKS